VAAVRGNGVFPVGDASVEDRLLDGCLRHAQERAQVRAERAEQADGGTADPTRGLSLPG
jgi:hypothetical protein